MAETQTATQSVPGCKEAVCAGDAVIRMASLDTSALQAMVNAEDKDIVCPTAVVARDPPSSKTEHFHEALVAQVAAS